MLCVFFYLKFKGDFIMPTTKFQRTIFALITVVITVHAFVFYNLYVVEGEFFRSIAGATGVLDGIYKNGGVMMFGRTFPIWAVVLLEFVLAFTLENVMGKNFDDFYNSL
jgi:hypothetical protein